MKSMRRLRIVLATSLVVTPSARCAGLAQSDSSSFSSSSSVPPIYTARFTSVPFEADLLQFVEKCESSISCAGVSIEPKGDIADGGRLYRHSFVGSYRTSKTYETRKKDFTYHRGEVRISPSGEEVIEVREDVTVAQAKDVCKSLLSDCVAFTYPVRSLTNLDRPPKVTFVSEVREFIPSMFDEWRTYVINDPAREGRIKVPDQLRYDRRVAANPYRTCCKGEDIPPMEEVVKVDTLERISCDISREEFFLKYELPRRPVMLVGCEKDWPAAKEQKWLPKTLATRFSNDTGVWRARVGWGEDMEYDEDYNHNVRWQQIAERMRSGEPYYLFDKLFNPEAKMIEDEYEDPKPVQGGDLYEKLSYFDGPLKWFNVGPGGTGTQSHLDPYSTDAWNTLLQGHKWWVIYPEGFVDESKLECEPSCSVEVPLTPHWYSSVGVNAARSEYVVGGYGRHVLQEAGETIYIPAGLIHAVYSYDEVVAITKNYASAANLDEIWMETVTSGDRDKWRSMYYHTLNRAQRRRVRQSPYWPPGQWEEDKSVPDCDNDEDADSTDFPMREYDPKWAPQIGDLVEVEYSFAGDDVSHWAMARVLTVQDSAADVEFLDNKPNDGKDYQFEFLRALPKEGDVVEAQSGGNSIEWYKATVVKAYLNATWDVHYAHGDMDFGLTRVSLREHFPFSKGEMVQMLRRKDGQEYWVDSTISDISSTADAKEGVTVKHFDGKEVEDVPSKLLRRVRWYFEIDEDVVVSTVSDYGEDSFYKGRVTNVRKNGRYDIFFDDGDSDSCVSWRALRFPWAMEDGWDEE
mmetsp:Transcript_7910/g.23401  ORF Transcript_7910/g.23401 Transcript_7910/m.23401 type:complete len:801 (-) Transcript_7910:34-2436(-)